MNESQQEFTLNDPPTKLPRPDKTFDNEYIVRYVAEQLYPDLSQYYDPIGKEEDKLDDINELMDFLKENEHNILNGFQLAKQFTDDFLCEGSTELCETFECAYHLRDTAHSILVRAWIQKCNITPRFKVDDKVKIYDHRNGRLVEGIIRSVLKELAEYMVHSDAIHKRPTMGIILPFEDVEELNKKKV